MSPEHRRPALPLAAAVVAIVAWGFGPLGVRAIDAPASTIVMWRMLLAMPIAVAVAYLTGGRLSVALMRRSFTTGVCFAISIVSGFLSFQRTSIASATLIPALQPALILLVATRLFGERRRRSELAWAALAFVGVAVVVLGASGGHDTVVGDVLAVVNLLVFTAYFLLAKQARSTDVHSWSFLAAVFAWTSLLVVPWALVVNGGVTVVHGVDWLIVVGIVIGPGMIGHGFMTWAHHYVDVTVTSLLTLANPVVSIVGAWWLFSQGLTGGQMAGVVVVLVATAAIVLGQRAARPVASR